MDGDRFDRLTRMLTSERTRRSLARFAAGALLAAARPGRAAACDPNCAGKACGGDGCGGSCGTCPLGSVCIDDLGTCVADPPVCRLVGESCTDSIRCCDLLICNGTICALPACVPTGGPCGPGADCCEGDECIVGYCQKLAQLCAPTGGSCETTDCCEATDTCLVEDNGSHVCTPTPPITAPCAHPGERPVQMKSECCSRLHLENGRCVVNLWDRCDRRRKGRRAPCEKGARCRGGKYAAKGHPVCVPK